MRADELYRLTLLSYDHVAKNGRDAARIYCAVVELDRQAQVWRKRAIALGWTDPAEVVPSPVDAAPAEQ